MLQLGGAFGDNFVVVLGVVEDCSCVEGGCVRAGFEFGGDRGGVGIGIGDFGCEC